MRVLFLVLAFLLAALPARAQSVRAYDVALAAILSVARAPNVDVKLERPRLEGCSACAKPAVKASTKKKPAAKSKKPTARKGGRRAA